MFRDRARTRHRRFTHPYSQGLALVTLLSTFILFSFASALDVPALRGRVNDYANLMPPSRAQSLEQRLEQFENETGHQIAVLTIPSLQGEDIEGFSIRVAENWKIGKKGFDNGVILLIAKNDRRLRIEVGYGLEGILPDAIASRIIREIVAPRFRANDYVGGIEAGADAIMKVTKGEPLPETQRRKPLSSTHLPNGLLLPLILLAFFVLNALSWRSTRSAWGTRGRRYYSGWWMGGGFGGGGFGGGGGFSGGGGGFGGGGASGGW